MGKRVTLVNTNQVKPAIAPLAFDYLAGPLRRQGFELSLLDLCFVDDFDAAIEQHCREHSPSYWGVTLRNTDDVYYSSKHSFLGTIRDMVSALRRARDVPIIVGGAGYSVMPEKLLSYLGADFGVVREGEFSFPALLTCLEESRPFDDIPGLVFRSSEGVQATRRDQRSLGALDALEVHERVIVDNQRYFRLGGQVGIETKRGCNRSCIYCVEPMIKGRRIRMRDPAAVVDEMEALADVGIDVFHINDSEFNLSVAHPIAVCTEIVRRGLESRIRWYAYGMPRPFPDELGAAMRTAGCVGMNFGVDSASSKMLRILRRTFEPADIERSVGVAKKYGLEHIVELLFGAPGETEETVRETIDFIRRVEPQRVSVTVGLRIFPGTELESLVRAEGWSLSSPSLSGHLDDNGDLLHPVFYMSPGLGDDPQGLVAAIIGDDPRFFGTNDHLFNYNANDALVEAIERGERGAYWAILHRLEQRMLHAQQTAERAGRSLPVLREDGQAAQPQPRHRVLGGVG